MGGWWNNWLVGFWDITIYQSNNEVNRPKNNQPITLYDDDTWSQQNKNL
jgi:hypothetical protein